MFFFINTRLLEGTETHSAALLLGYLCSCCAWWQLPGRTKSAKWGKSI